MRGLSKFFWYFWYFFDFAKPLQVIIMKYVPECTVHIIHDVCYIMIDGFNSINAARCRKWQIGEVHKQWNQFGRK